MEDREITIKVENSIGVSELRVLKDLESMNYALSKEEFTKIISVYNEMITRIENEAEKQGIKI